MWDLLTTPLVSMVLPWISHVWLMPQMGSMSLDLPNFLYISLLCKSCQCCKQAQHIAKRASQMCHVFVTRNSVVDLRTYRLGRERSRLNLSLLSNADESRSRGWARGGKVWNSWGLGIMACCGAIMTAGEGTAAWLVAGWTWPKMTPANG